MCDTSNGVLFQDCFGSQGLLCFYTNFRIICSNSVKNEKRYTHLKAKFQRLARREKKVFLSEQCKEIEENNRMGKTRDLFNKIRDPKGTFHGKTGTIRTETVWT